MPLAFPSGTSSQNRNTLQQRKFKIKVLVLLHILIPGVMLSSLKTINPWLSACDLAQPAPPDLQGSCSVTQLYPWTVLQSNDETLSCPMPCPLNQSSADSQCLAYLDETRKNAICNFSSGSRSEWLKKFLGQIRLRHCCEYKIIESLSGVLLERVLRGKEECFQTIDSLVDVDNLAARVSCEFTEVLSRFDCGQSYSVRFSCEDCKEAYRKWVCSSLVPFFNGTKRIRPCRSVCQAVEQRCPYFLPENRAPSLPTQYAGEPTFLCIDPNIPETGEQLKRSLYPEKGTCCVKPCGLPQDGLCVEKGTKCEDLVPYENATTEECNGTDGSVSRAPNEDCPGPATHPSFKASAVPRIGPRPLVVAASTFLTLRPNHPQISLALMALALILNNCPYGIVHFLACYYIFTSGSRISGVNRLRLKASYHLIKISKLIFNYFKFNSNKWQYYFILISVNLGNGSDRFFRTPSLPPKPQEPQPPPQPSPRPPQTRNGLVQIINVKKLKRGLISKHYIKILFMSAQKLIINERSKLCGLATNGKKSISHYIVIETIITQGCGVSLKYNSSTINRLKVISMMILKVLLIKILHCRLNYKMRELCNAFDEQCTDVNNRSSCCCCCLNNRPPPLPPPLLLLLLLMLLLTVSTDDPYIRTNVVGKSMCMLINSSRQYKFVWYYLKKKKICNVLRFV